MKFFIFFILSSQLFAGIKHDSVSSRLYDFSYEDFCKSMNAKSTLLISSINANEIECFNQKFKIREFCIKKMALDSNFTRGFGVENEKKIYCEEAINVSLNIDCDDIKGICSNAISSCEKLKNIYAYSLDLSHYSITNKKLNCYFTKKNTEDFLNEI